MPVKQIISRIKKIGKAILQSFKEYGEEHSFTYGAALSYYSIFAIVPTLYLAVTVIGVIFGEDYLLIQLQTGLSETVGEESAVQITETVRSLNISNSGILMNTISIAALIYSTTAIFWSIKSSLHMMWNLKPEVKSKILKTIIDRLVSLIMLIIIGLVIALVFVAETTFVLIVEHLHVKDLEGISYGVYVLEHTVGIILHTLIFILIFKYLPDAKIRWRTILTGAIFTGVLFYIGTYLVSWYLSVVPFTNRLGAAGPILIFLLWVYYSAQIVFLGAKFTHVWSKVSGFPITDNNYRFLNKKKSKSTKMD